MSIFVSRGTKARACRAQRLAARVAIGTVQAQAMVSQSVDVGFLEAGDGLVGRKRELMLAKWARPGCASGSDMGREETPFLVRQHRHIHLAAPAVHHARH